MGRTASPATPGTNPTDSTAPSALSQAGGLETNTDDLKVISTGPVEGDTTEDEVTRLKREMAELKALVHQMGRNQAVASAEPVELPTMKEVLARKPAPTIPVLTQDGWYVPAVHPTDRASSKL